jgi:hypothetical protein
MRPLLLLSFLVLALVACGSNQDDATPSAPTASGTGPGITIQDAIDSDLEGPLYVRGFLYTQAGTTRLCDGFAESYPPQCMAPSLEVLGLKLVEQRQLYKTGGGVSASGGVSWSEEPITLLGTVQDATLTVSNDAMP